MAAQQMCIVYGNNTEVLVIVCLLYGMKCNSLIECDIIRTSRLFCSHRYTYNLEIYKQATHFRIMYIGSTVI